MNSFELEANELLELTSTYSEHEELIDAFESNERKQLAELTEPIFERLNEEHQLSVLEFGDQNGTVFFRGHNPEKYGDSKGELKAIQSTLNGEEIAGFEFGSSGLAVRAFAPIIVNNEIIGTLQTGINDEFLEDITVTIQGVELQIYNKLGESVISSNETTGNTLDATKILETVLSGEEISIEEEDSLNTYLPLYDPTKTDVIGIIRITQDISILNHINEKTTVQTFIIAGLTLLFVALAGYFSSKSIIKPIKDLTSFMNEFAKGKLNATFKGKASKDEIGQLTRSIIQMQNSFKTMVERIKATSDVIENESTLVSQSAHEVNEGSQQIAATIEELAAGSESQANSSLELSAKVNAFSEDIKQSHDSGQVIAKTADQVLTLTNNGQDLMNNSVHEMNSIHQLVTDSVQKVKDLDTQASNITEMIKVIENIAEQTNLLALNAAIEAARAGEHGRGFSVVANEVRTLAEGVKHSLGDITSTVNGIQQGSHQVTVSLQQSYEKVKSGSEQMTHTQHTFEQITDSVSTMVNKINLISNNLNDITNESMEITSVVENIASISEEAAAGIEQTSASVQQVSSSMEQIPKNAKRLEDLAKELNDLIRQFTF